MTDIKIKGSAVPAKRPATDPAQARELYWNDADQVLGISDFSGQALDLVDLQAPPPVLGGDIDADSITFSADQTATYTGIVGNVPADGSAESVMEMTQNNGIITSKLASGYMTVAGRVTAVYQDADTLSVAFDWSIDSGTFETASDVAVLLAIADLGGNIQTVPISNLQLAAGSITGGGATIEVHDTSQASAFVPTDTLDISVQVSGKFGATVLPNDLIATPSEYTRTSEIFDTRAAQGINEADIPVNGFCTLNDGTTPAPDGVTIEARIVDASSGAQVHPWVTVATTSNGDGSFSGTYPSVPRNANAWLRLQTRAEFSTDVNEATGRFATGHVIGLIGQSEEERMFDSSFDKAGDPQSDYTYPTLGDEDAVHVLYQIEKGSTPFPIHYREVTNSTPVTAAIANMADTLTQAAPGEKFLIVDLARVGTGRENLANDGQTAREWSDFAAVVDTVRENGSDIGLLMDTWTAQDSKSGDNFRLIFYPFHFGIYADGSDYPLVPPTDNLGSTFNHILFDLSTDGTRGYFDAAKTSYLFYGPHRFEDGLIPNAQNKQDTRTSIRNILDDAQVQSVLAPVGKGIEILNYQNGYGSATTGTGNPDPNGPEWVDASHPSEWHQDGLNRRGRLIMFNALRALGIVNIERPVFNRSYWHPDGDYVEVWFEYTDGGEPPITTTRLQRGLPPAGDTATYPYRTQVTGFVLSGNPAEDATIVNGRVRIRANGGGQLTASDSIEFGLLAASGQYTYPEDEFEDMWMDLPVIDPLVPTIEGVTLEALPDPADLANTLPSPAYFTTSGSTGRYFEQAGNLGTSNTGQMVFSGMFRSIAGPPNYVPFAITGGGFTVERLSSNGFLRLNLKDNAGVKLIDSVTTAVSVPEATWYTLVISIDIPGQAFGMWLNGGVANGGQEYVVALPASGDPRFETSRSMTLHNSNGNGGSNFRGDCQWTRVWNGETTSDGTEPVAAATADVTGGPSVANSHPWKRGSVDATGTEGGTDLVIESGATIYTLSGTTGHGWTPDGVAWVTGTPQIEAIQPTPVDLGGGDWRNGWGVNPQHAGSTNNQPFDGRIGHFKLADMSLPKALATDDIVVGSKARPDSYQGVRQGVTSRRGYGGLMVLSAPPAADMFAPALIGWPARPNIDGYSVDLDNFIAGRPTLDPTGIDAPPVDEVLDLIGKVALGHAIDWSANNIGYEAALPNRFGLTSNYGDNTQQSIGAAGLLTTLSSTTNAECKELLKWLIHHGIQWHDTLDNHPDGKLNPDGAHNSFLATAMIFGLSATGRSASIDTLVNRLPGNIFGQPFIIDQPFIDGLAPHDSATGSTAGRRRQVTAINGNVVTLETFGDGSDPIGSKWYPEGAFIERESDSARAQISATYNGSMSLPTMDLTAPGHVLSVSDVVTIQPDVPPVLGQPEWAVRYLNDGVANNKTWVPGAGASYRRFARWSSHALTLKAWGFANASLTPAYDWTSFMADPTWPSVGDPYAEPWNTMTLNGVDYDFEETFWSAHAAALGL